MNSNNIIVVIIGLLVIGAVATYFVLSGNNPADAPTVPAEQPTTITPPINETPDTSVVDTPAAVATERGDSSVLGTSVAGEDITAFHFGTGAAEVVFVGGIHGGYSWNTTLLAYELIDYLDANPTAVPANLTVTVIPVANPDGLKATVGTVGRFAPAAAARVTEVTRVEGRFNANDVDLNRNFDCEWSTSGEWQNRTVSGGAAPFSEPEAVALRNYIENNTLAALVVWFSAEGKVYPAACGTAPTAAATSLANTYGNAAGYPVETNFTAYQITGDITNWAAKQNITAISILLTDHQSTEWTKNKAGIEAILNSLSE